MSHTLNDPQLDEIYIERNPDFFKITGEHIIVPPAAMRDVIRRKEKKLDELLDEYSDRLDEPQMTESERNRAELQETNDRIRTSKNILLAVAYINLTEDERSTLRRWVEDYKKLLREKGRMVNGALKLDNNKCPKINIFKVSTAKNFVGYLGTERMKVNVKMMEDSLKNSQKSKPEPLPKEILKFDPLADLKAGLDVYYKERHTGEDFVAFLTRETEKFMNS